MTSKVKSKLSVSYSTFAGLDDIAGLGDIAGLDDIDDRSIATQIITLHNAGVTLAADVNIVCIMLIERIYT